jgi:hypothetical protein
MTPIAPDCALCLESISIRPLGGYHLPVYTVLLVELLALRPELLDHHITHILEVAQSLL